MTSASGSREAKSRKAGECCDSAWIRRAQWATRTSVNGADGRGNRMTNISYIYTAAATLLALVLLQVLTIVVAQARVRYGIKAPSVTGNERFERAFRVHMNTVEQMAFFLPAM